MSDLKSAVLEAAERGLSLETGIHYTILDAVELPDGTRLIKDVRLDGVSIGFGIKTPEGLAVMNPRAAECNDTCV